MIFPIVIMDFIVMSGLALLPNWLANNLEGYDLLLGISLFPCFSFEVELIL